MTTFNAVATVCHSSNADANASTIQKSNKHKPLHRLFSSTFGRLTATYSGVHFATTKKEMTHMPHENEYAAAVAGMAEIYGTPKALPAVGDFVSGVTAGKRWSGHIEWFGDDDATVVVNVDHAWVRVPVKDITH